jgi:hypothetical protein
MNYYQLPFRQFRLIVLLTTLIAVTYVINTEMTLLSPLLFFSGVMISFINIIEVFSKKHVHIMFKSIHILILLFFIFGFRCALIACIAWVKQRTSLYKRIYEIEQAHLVGRAWSVLSCNIKGILKILSCQMNV